MGNISIVIGSWGSYNECNEKALGSKWLDLSDYSDWEEIVEELKREGFELDGIDEELFIQDIEGIYDRSVNWDYMNPENLFNTLYESGVLSNNYKYKELCAFLEVKNYDDFEELVKNRGENWDDKLRFRHFEKWCNYEVLQMFGAAEREELSKHADTKRSFGKSCNRCNIQSAGNAGFNRRYSRANNGRASKANGRPINPTYLGRKISREEIVHRQFDSGNGTRHHQSNNKRTTECIRG